MSASSLHEDIARITRALNDAEEQLHQTLDGQIQDIIRVQRQPADQLRADKLARDLKELEQKKLQQSRAEERA